MRITLQAGRHLLGAPQRRARHLAAETGNLSLSIEPVPLEPLLRDVCELARPLASAKDIRLDDDSAPSHRPAVTSEPITSACARC